MPGKRDQLDADYVAVFSTEHGERVLRDMMSRCCFWEPTFDQSPQAAAFNEGKRSVVLYILECVRPKQMSHHEVAEQYSQSLADYPDH